MGQLFGSLCLGEPLSDALGKGQEQTGPQGIQGL